MSFNLLEFSLFKGKPQRLYRFVIQHLQLCYTSHDKPVTAHNTRYEPLAIKDNGIRQKGQESSDILKIGAPFNFEPARLFLNGRPSIALTVFDKHAGSDEALAVWHGEVMEVGLPNAASCEVVCRPLGTRPMTGLTLSWSRECPYTLYDKNCKVKADDFAVTFNVHSIEERRLTAQGGLDAYEDGWFKGGFIRFTDASGLVFTRGIATHQGNQLTLMNRAPLKTGQPLLAYAGCNQLISTCKHKFNNLDNCGACPHMPGKSPFDGRNVF